MGLRSIAKRLIAPLLLTFAFTLTAFGQTTGALSGTVHDPQGNAISGAKVTVSDTAKNFQAEATTNAEGTFSFASLLPSTYSVTVEAQGFKKYVQSGITINVADRQSTGTIQLEVGSLTGETVEVTADSAQLQIKTESGEQGTAINNNQIQNLAVNGRNYLDLLKVTPGIVVTAGFATSGPGGLGNISIAGTRQYDHSLTIDGTSNVDTGSNGTQHIALSLDNIAEFKVLVSNYQAEYGRSGGGAIQIVTKSGTKDFHGTGYYFHRHEQFNANSFFNNANGRNSAGALNNPRNFYRYNQQGFNVGGPVYIPKVFEKMREKLFFFYSQEWQEQLVPQAARQSRVPTALEVAGDFSQTKDNDGNPIFIKDPSSPNPCSASNTLGCFLGNKIPTNQLNPNGVAILKLFNKFENTPLGGQQNASRWNHNSQQSVSYPRREKSIRVDYNLTDNHRAYVRYTVDSDYQSMPYGLGWTGGSNQIPFDNLIFKQAPAWNSVLNLTSTLSSTMTNEFIFGASKNTLTLDPTNPNAATYSGIGFNFKTPFPYPAEQWFNISFGGISGQNFAGTNGYSQFPYKNGNITFDLYDNVSKIYGTHTFKGGFFFERSRKDQVAGNSASINFSNNTNDPNNTGHPYANALLGNFNTYSQPNIGLIQGQYRYSNYEFYLQDNWKVNNRLTLDYGMRFYWMRPQFDKRYQDFYFDASKYSSSKVVSLYRPTCSSTSAFVDGKFCADSSNQRAYDPRTGDALNAAKNPSLQLPSYLIGRIVPGSGDPFNGQVNGKDYYPGGIKDRGLQYGPNLGFAYDVFGNKKTVVRGGYRLAFDRVQGNELVFAAVGQPPLYQQPTFTFGNLSTVGTGTGPVALGTSGVIASDPSGVIPNIQSFSLQVQQDIGFNSVLSVAYVGTLSRHQQELLNLNYSPYGELFTKAAQDPSKFAGGVVPDVEPGLPKIYSDAGLKFSGQYALAADFLKKYQGYNTIGLRTLGGSSNYHSLQVALNRRLTGNFSYGLAYTYSKVMGTANQYSDFINPVCSRCADYRRLAYDRTHVMVINYDYRIPGLKDSNWLLKSVVNGWQVTGVTQFSTGTPNDVNAGIANINLGQRLGGTWTESVRGYFTGDPQTYADKVKYFNWETIRLPSIPEALAAKGAYPRNFVVSPGINVTDLSLFKNFALGGDSARNLQLRFEMFNVFNHPQFSDMNRTVTWRSFAEYENNRQAGAPSVTNTNSPNVQNVRGSTLSGNPRLGNGIGEINSLSGNVAGQRIIQLAVKVFF